MTKMKNRTEAEGRELISEWKGSGLSQDRFAKQFGVSVSVLRYWVARIREIEQKPSKKKPVHFLKVLEKQNQTAKQQEVRLFLPGGLMMAVSELPSPDYVAELSMSFARRLPC